MKKQQSQSFIQKHFNFVQDFGKNTGCDMCKMIQWSSERGYAVDLHVSILSNFEQ